MSVNKDFKKEQVVRRKIMRERGKEVKQKAKQKGTIPNFFE